MAHFTDFESYFGFDPYESEKIRERERQREHEEALKLKEASRARSTEDLSQRMTERAIEIAKDTRLIEVPVYGVINETTSRFIQKIVTPSSGSIKVQKEFRIYFKLGSKITYLDCEVTVALLNLSDIGHPPGSRKISYKVEVEGLGDEAVLEGFFKDKLVIRDGYSAWLRSKGEAHSTDKAFNDRLFRRCRSWLY